MRDRWTEGGRWQEKMEGEGGSDRKRMGWGLNGGREEGSERRAGEGVNGGME